MGIDSMSGQRSRTVSSPETSLGAFLKAEQEKRLRENLRTSFGSQGRLIHHKVTNEFHSIILSSKYPPPDRLFARIPSEQNDHNSFSQTTNRNPLCSFLWHALGLDFVFCGSLGSLPHCFRKRRVGCEPVSVVWFVVN